MAVFVCFFRYSACSFVVITHGLSVPEGRKSVSKYPSCDFADEILFPEFYGVFCAQWIADGLRRDLAIGEYL